MSDIRRYKTHQNHIQNFEFNVVLPSPGIPNSVCDEMTCFVCKD